jgi:hypothetical protein
MKRFIFTCGAIFIIIFLFLTVGCDRVLALAGQNPACENPPAGWTQKDWILVYYAEPEFAKKVLAGQITPIELINTNLDMQLNMAKIQDQLLYGPGTPEERQNKMKKQYGGYFIALERLKARNLIKS